MPKAKTKTKSVKLPCELLELVEKHGKGKSPGKVLLAAYRDYLNLYYFAKKISAKNGSDLDSVTGIIQEYMHRRDEKISDLEVRIEEVRTVALGLKIFFTKVKQP